MLPIFLIDFLYLIWVFYPITSWDENCVDYKLQILSNIFLVLDSLFGKCDFAIYSVVIW